MSTPARDNYLAAEVLTAPPQKLHLMLIEAALRFSLKARQLWQAGEDSAACEALLRAQDVLGEMLAGLNREADDALARRVAAIYLFVFRSLLEANRDRDEAKLAGAIRVLEIERETWRQVCEKLEPERHDAPHPAEPAPHRPPIAPPLVVEPPQVGEPAGGFSLDA